MNRRFLLPSAIAALALGVIAVRLLTLGPDPKEAARLHREAIELEKNGRTEDALARLRAAIAHDPESIPINRDYQNLMRRSGKIEDARAEYRRRAANFPNSAGAQYLGARLEDGEALEKGMLRVLELDAGFVWAHRALGAYYSDEHRPDAAVRHLERAAAAREASPDDARTLTAFLYKHDRYEDIDRILEGWLARRPPFAQEDAALSCALGRRPNNTAVQLHVALDPQIPFLYALRIVRADYTFRQISVRRDGARYVIAWTREWMLPEQPDGGPELWDRPDRPTFAEIHSAAASRLMADEK